MVNVYMLLHELEANGLKMSSFGNKLGGWSNLMLRQIYTLYDSYIGTSHYIEN